MGLIEYMKGFRTVPGAPSLQPNRVSVAKIPYSLGYNMSYVHTNTYDGAMAAEPVHYLAPNPMNIAVLGTMPQHPGLPDIPQSKAPVKGCK